MKKEFTKIEEITPEVIEAHMAKARALRAATMRDLFSALFVKPVKSLFATKPTDANEQAPVNAATV